MLVHDVDLPAPHTRGAFPKRRIACVWERLSGKEAQGNNRSRCGLSATTLESPREHGGRGRVL